MAGAGNHGPRRGLSHPHPVWQNACAGKGVEMRVMLAAVLVLVAGAVQAETLVGPARAIDGDTVEVAGRTVRLLSVDAPERGQVCTDGAGVGYPCGDRATAALVALVAGRRVTCAGLTRDTYGRLLARCDAGDGDLGARMVLTGQAVAFAKLSDDYVAEERLARKGGMGLWSGRFERPWDVRKATWAGSAAPCAGDALDGAKAGGDDLATCGTGPLPTLN